MEYKKPCNCNFCNQFFFARQKKNYYSKQKDDIYGKKIDSNNIINFETKLIPKPDIESNDIIDKKTNDETNTDDKQQTEKSLEFTLKELDIVSTLILYDMNTKEISKQTNISESVVQHILNTIYFWKK